MSNQYNDQKALAHMQEILNAAKAGREIEYRVEQSSWIPKTGGLFDFALYEYRVKPEPLVCYANLYDGGMALHQEKAEALKCASARALRVAVKMVEASDE